MEAEVAVAAPAEGGVAAAVAGAATGAHLRESMAEATETRANI
jgi:hypothetical protein